MLERLLDNSLNLDNYSNYSNVTVGIVEIHQNAWHLTSKDEAVGKKEHSNGKTCPPQLVHKDSQKLLIFYNLLKFVTI